MSPGTVPLAIDSMTRGREPSSDAGGRGLASTGKLLRLARSGRADAIEMLCRRCLPDLRRWAHGRLPGWARLGVDSEDLIQDTLMRSLKALPRFEDRGEGAWRAYLHTVLCNRVREEVRRAVRRASAQGSLPEAAGAHHSPLEQAIGHEALERYEKALAMLKPQARAAVVLRLESGCSYAQLAELLEKSTPDAARAAVSRALRRLAYEMGHER